MLTLSRIPSPSPRPFTFNTTSHFSTCRFVLAHLFQLILAVDAVSAKNTIQIMGLCLFNTLFLVYAVIQVRSGFWVASPGRAVATGEPK